MAQAAAATAAVPAVEQAPVPATLPLAATAAERAAREKELSQAFLAAQAASEAGTCLTHHAHYGCRNP